VVVCVCACVCACACVCVCVCGVCVCVCVPNSFDVPYPPCVEPPGVVKLSPLVCVQVLDTWFSSGLWPFATVGWPQQGKLCLPPSIYSIPLAFKGAMFA